MMSRDKLIAKLGSELMKDLGKQAPEWKHLVMVGRFEDGEPAMNGFAYLSDGTAEPVAPTDFDILDTLAALRSAMADEDRKSPWSAALFKIDRGSKELEGEFEYTDPSKWTITFKNSKERARQFRPDK